MYVYLCMHIQRDIDIEREVHTYGQMRTICGMTKHILVILLRCSAA